MPSRGPARIGLVSEAGTGPIVTLSDGRVTLRPWSRDDAQFMADASGDPAIRRYNGVHDRHGRPAPPLSKLEAEAAIDQFVVSWQTFATTGAPVVLRSRLQTRDLASWWAAAALTIGLITTWRGSATGSQQTRGGAVTPRGR